MAPAPEKKAEVAQSASTPDIALLQLLQSAFNRQSPAIYPQSVATLNQSPRLREQPVQQLQRQLLQGTGRPAQR